jgi:hypothetical protein
MSFCEFIDLLHFCPKVSEIYTYIQAMLCILTPSKLPLGLITIIKGIVKIAGKVRYMEKMFVSKLC